MTLRSWIVAGTIAGFVTAGVVVASGALDDESVARPTASPSPTRPPRAEAFIEAYERSRLATFVVESSFRRALADGGGFTGTSTTAQRPPDRLEIKLGSVAGRVDGRIVLCGTTSGGTYSCDSSRERLTYDESVAREVSILRTYVDGTLPLYGVETDGDCFDLRQERPLPAAPYGTSARFCFADETGAPTYSEIVRPEGTDVSEATSVRGRVRDSDLEAPRDGGASDAPTT